jgi:hypothetical protein
LRGASQYGHHATLMRLLLKSTGDAECFVRSIKEECVDQLIPIGERHFRTAIREHFSGIIRASAIAPSPATRSRRGAFLNFYQRAA